MNFSVRSSRRRSARVAQDLFQPLFADLAVQRAVVLGNERWRDEDSEIGGAAPAGSPMTPSGESFRFDVPFREAKEEAVSRWERDYLSQLLEANLGNLSRAARQVQMDWNYLRELLRKHGIDRE